MVDDTYDSAIEHREFIKHAMHISQLFDDHEEQMLDEITQLRQLVQRQYIENLSLKQKNEQLQTQVSQLTAKSTTCKLPLCNIVKDDDALGMLKAKASAPHVGVQKSDAHKTSAIKTIIPTAPIAPAPPKSPTPINIQFGCAHM
ncbi:MAG: hypothetical protein Faunusvirus1_68 [Faunusvirus sp.]|jgi:hypothetical protein|uniref:Uncharacterized protein n=1 Tax=Faunusvirus sp. TaxID=2487766 RepID=A0A3G4ZVW8_9VIRU|nr:MAG: hypothetical protein Faunusvirus1_68 [Faunusvirus sp.]